MTTNIACFPANTARVNKPHTHVATNSGNNEWFTPAYIIDAARAVMGGIDLDPASNDIAQGWIGAKRYYTAHQNGLAQVWRDRVWLNPPYDKNISRFVNKLLEELEHGRVGMAITLTNNATDTTWGQLLLRYATAVCFHKGRVRFLDESLKEGAPLQGQMICGFFNDRYDGIFATNTKFHFAREFRHHFGPLGAVLTREYV